MHAFFPKSNFLALTQLRVNTGAHSAVAVCDSLEHGNTINEVRIHTLYRNKHLPTETV